MPIYSFACDACNAHWDVLTEAMKAPRPGRCPVCGREDKARRVWSAPTIVFRGPGFYSTDKDR